mmetsp:Transcript_35907/g.90264  ORF Transcript_35907/g.90264 Transcript_35907/m.90264 type:complete len:95 (+) Transcript_35907:191-475(+)
MLAENEAAGGGVALLRLRADRPFLRCVTGAAEGSGSKKATALAVPLGSTARFGQLAGGVVEGNASEALLSKEIKFFRTAASAPLALAPAVMGSP